MKSTIVLKKERIYREMIQVMKHIELYFTKKSNRIHQLHHRFINLIDKEMEMNIGSQIQSECFTGITQKRQTLMKIHCIEEFYHQILNTLSPNSLTHCIQKQNSLHLKISQLAFKALQYPSEYISIIFKPVAIRPLTPLTIIVKPYPMTQVIKVSPLDLFFASQVCPEGNAQDSFSLTLCAFIIAYAYNKLLIASDN